MLLDKYESLAALRKELQEGVDFRVRVLDRNSKITVIAPHGGFIEAGTSAIARAVAGRNYNLYDFQGLRVARPAELHVTSTNFRDRPLVRLLRKSCTAVSLHCMGNSGREEIWLGGLNNGLKQIVLDGLTREGFSVNPDSPKYRGESRRNVVNLPSCRGVQLELSEELLSGMFISDRFFASSCRPVGGVNYQRLVGVLRASLKSYCALNRARKTG